MSEWIKPEKEDIVIDNGEKEVDIYVTHNDFGNVYLILTFDQVREICADVDRSDTP